VAKCRANGDRCSSANKWVSIFWPPPLLFSEYAEYQLAGFSQARNLRTATGPWSSWSMSGPLAGSGRVQLRPVADSTTWSLWTICPLSSKRAFCTFFGMPSLVSTGFLIALGARTIHEVSDLVRRAAAAGKSLATLAVDTEVRFKSPADRAAFTSELSDAITKLVAKYHDESAPPGRSHQFVVMANPTTQAQTKE